MTREKISHCDFSFLWGTIVFLSDIFRTFTGEMEVRRRKSLTKEDCLALIFNSDPNDSHINIFLIMIHLSYAPFKYRFIILRQ